MTTPDTIGNYRIIREIGRGGMGIVYLADDPVIDRQVALKLLPAGLAADARARASFEREVTLFSRLEHPHIVPVYAVNVSEGAPFLVMRYLPGGTLRSWLAEGRLSREKLWRAMRHIAQALDYAHSQGLVHRDVKPTNILFDNHGNVYVSDFGIAKILNATAFLTATTMTGTPAYMSPEQFSNKTVDGRADQYSLAVVLFESLTGQLPFEGDTLQMMYQHVYEPPALIHTVDQDLPPGLSDVLDRALAKKPDDRYATTEAFIAAAEPAATAPVATAPAATPSPAKPPQPPSRSAQSAIPPAPQPAIVPGAGGKQPAPQRQKPRVRAEQPAPVAIVPQAGGTPVPEKRRWLRVILPLALILLGALALFLLLRPTDNDALAEDSAAAAAPTETQQPTAEPSPTGAAPTAPPTTAPPTAEANGLELRLMEDGVATDQGWQIPGNGEAVAVQSNDATLHLQFDSGAELYLTPQTQIRVAQGVGEDAPALRLVLEFGRLLVAWPGEDGPDAEALGPLEVANPLGARVVLSEGLMGVGGSLDPLRFEVDCLAGECAVAGDLGGEIVLGTGERSVIGGSGIPSDPRPARFELYAGLAGLVPTPTATPTATATATATPTHTPTPRPLNTATSPPVPASTPNIQTPTPPAPATQAPPQPQPSVTPPTDPIIPTRTTTPAPTAPPPRPTTAPPPTAETAVPITATPAPGPTRGPTPGP